MGCFFFLLADLFGLPLDLGFFFDLSEGLCTADFGVLHLFLSLPADLSCFCDGDFDPFLNFPSFCCLTSDSLQVTHDVAFNRIKQVLHDLREIGHVGQDFSS